MQYRCVTFSPLFRFFFLIMGSDVRGTNMLSIRHQPPWSEGKTWAEIDYMNRAAIVCPSPPLPLPPPFREKRKYRIPQRLEGEKKKKSKRKEEGRIYCLVCVQVRMRLLRSLKTQHLAAVNVGEFCRGERQHCNNANRLTRGWFFSLTQRKLYRQTYTGW